MSFGKWAYFARGEVTMWVGSDNNKDALSSWLAKHISIITQ